MFEFLHPENAFSILKADHDKVKDIFDKFEKAESQNQKKKLAADAIAELKIHATIEEEIFYPALRATKQVEKDLLNEADEEHHVAKLLIAELEQMSGTEMHYEAKFTVLSENIRHHIKEEEHELFPQAHKTPVDFDLLGKRLLSRKQYLKKNGVPPCAEEKLMARNKSADSPVRSAKLKKSGKSVRKNAAKKRTIIKKVGTKKVGATGKNARYAKRA